MKALSMTAAGFLLPAAKYWARLALDPATLDEEPSLQKLQQLQESHLANVPFENLAQHGSVGGPAVLDIATTANKILDQNRGGFCFELNTLFGNFLRQLGYSVKFVLAHVRAGDAFHDKATHVILIVECQSQGDQTMIPYYVDVGFGEPPLHPLEYHAFGTEQQTPEGMKSKIVRQGDQVELHWLRGGSWQPRLKWSYKGSLVGVEMPDFAPGLAAVQMPESIFSQKLIVARLTRTAKMTLAGSRYKVTGPPRFADDGSQGPKEIRQLELDDSVLEAQKLLELEFGMPMSVTSGLSLEKSNTAAEELWSQM